MTDIGDVRRCGNYSGAVNQDGEQAAAFTTLAGVATDPAAVVLVVQKPDGTQLEYGWPAPGPDGVLTHEAAGRFYTDVPLDQAGTWMQLLTGTGAVQAASEDRWKVQRRRVVTP